MPIDTALCTKQWVRYAWCRDNGHSKFVEKADKCERFFAGDQWDRADKAALALVRRPALTINKIISTIGNVMGEQIFQRAETSFRPRSGAPADVADALTKVWKQISDRNQLDWKRSDMFADGIIGSRGYLDMRVEFDDSMTGKIVIDNLNPKNVIVDPDAEDYDPDKWSEVFTTKWLTADDVAILYGPEDAKLLRNREQSFFPYGYDSIQAFRDRFGDRNNPMYAGDYDNSSVLRNLRIIDRQHRMLDRQKHFVEVETGDTRPIPKEFDRNRIAFFVEKFGFQVITKLVRRIRWTVICDNVMLHDDWSPYKHFTVIPYFPYFRRGTTVGLVENLLDPQELLNKVSSQELHVVNTTANSGWKVKTGAITNMSPEELEQNGARTGLVIEVAGDPDKDVVKIAPNQVPAGLDRISFKAEDHIKGISGINDSMQGFDREDVAAKAIDAKKKSGSTGLAKPMDSLTRTDFILARNGLDLIQEFMTEQQLVTITHDHATGESTTITVNEASPEGHIINDLTLGEYDVVTTSIPHKESMEDDQFDQAVSMKEMGIAIPDSVIVMSSRLLNKTEIIKQMAGNQDSPEAKAAAALQQRGQQAEVAKLEGEAAQKAADASLKKAKTQETIVKAQVLANTPIESPDAVDPELDRDVANHEAALAVDKQEHDKQMDFAELNLKRETEGNKLRLQAQDMAAKRADARAAATTQAAAAAAKPQPKQGLRT